MKKRQFLKVSTVMAATATMIQAFDTPVLARTRISSGIPEGFNGFLVYLANGEIEPTELFITGLEAINSFHKQIMKRTDLEIEAHRKEAITFFNERFGTDVENTSDYSLSSYQINPKANYRAYVVGGERVPASGWIIRDGGWLLAVNNPNGVTLGGEFAGVEVPSGTRFLFGDYNILATNHRYSRQFREIIINLKSAQPIIFAPDGSSSFRCDVTSEKYGVGKAQGISAPLLQDNGLERVNIRNILTFSDIGGL